MNCLACNRQPADRHHIKTRGSGGTDEDFNLIALCRICHTAIHRMGSVKFILKHPNVEIHFRNKGWEIKEIFGIKKLVRSE